MEIIATSVTSNKTNLTNPNGYASPVIITRGWNFTSVDEDIVLINKDTQKRIPFVIIPLSEGQITVGLVGDSGNKYVISDSEVTAFLGSPMLYLIERIYKEGTTITTFNIGM